MSDLRIAIIARLVNRVRGPAREVQQDLRGIGEGTQEVTRQSDRAGRGQERLAALSVMAGRAAVAASLATVAAGGASVRNAAMMEEAWSEANKTLSLTPEPLAELRAEINKLAVEIPLANGSMVDIVSTAGQLGIRGQASIIEFTRDTAKMAATFDVSAGRAAEMQASWREQMGWTQAEVRMTADQINYLGNTTAAESSRVAEFYTGIANIADEAGMAREEVLALGAAMIASGRAPEVAATGMRALYRTMGKGYTDLSDRQAAVAAKLNLGGEKWNAIQRRMATDSTGAVREIVAAISQLPEYERNAAAGVLFGEEASRALGGLLVNVELLDKALARIPELQGAAGSMNEEYIALSDDVLDNWRRVRTVLTQRGTRFGNSVLDPINTGLKGFLRLLQTADQRVGVFERLGQMRLGLLDGLGLDTGPIESTLRRIRTGLEGLIFGKDRDPGEVLAKVYQRARRLGEGLAPVAEAAQRNLSLLASGLSGLVRIGGDIATGDFSTAQATLRGFADWLATADFKPIDLTGLLPDRIANMPVLKDFAGLLSEVLNTLGAVHRLVAGAASAALAGAFDGIDRHLGPVQDSLRATWDQVGQILQSIRSIAGSLTALFNSGSAAGDGKARMASFGAMLGEVAGVAARVSSGAIFAAATAINALFGALSKAIQGDFSGAVEQLQSLFDRLRDLVVPRLDFSGLFPDGNAAGLGALRSLVELVGALARLAGTGAHLVLTNLATGLREFFGSFRGHIDPMLDRAKGIGAQIQPILDHLTRIVNVVNNVFSSTETGAGMQSNMAAFGTFLGNLAGLAARIAVTGLEAVARALETILGVVAAVLEGDFGQAWTELKEFFDWLKNLVVDGLNLGELFDWPEPPRWLRWLMGDADAVQLETPTTSNTPAFTTLPQAQQDAVSRLEAAARDGQLPTEGRLSGMRDDIASMLAEIERVEGRVAQLRAGGNNRLANRDERGLDRLREDLSAAQTELAEAEKQSASLRADLVTLGETDATISLNTQAIDEAIRKTLQLRGNLQSLNAATPPPNRPVQARARGGTYRSGWRLVGENGPELEYMNAGGFIAHHRQLQQLAGVAERLASASAVSRANLPLGGLGDIAGRLPAFGASMQPAVQQMVDLGGRIRAAQSAPRASAVQARPRSAPRPAPTGPVTIHIHPQPGQDPRQIARLVKREFDRARGGELHDGGDYD